MPKQPRECECGCGEMTKGGRFRPGHDARMHAKAKKDKMATAINHARQPASPKADKEETAYRRPKPSTGSGPPCPMDVEHGRLINLQGVDDWWCPHSDHGGNGRFFQEEEARGDRVPAPDPEPTKAKRKEG